MSDQQIPHIDIAPLFGDDTPERRAVDASIQKASETTGFLVIANLPEKARLTPERRNDLLRLFQLPEAEIRKLWLWNFERSHKNIYRGWFPLQNGFPTYKEGIDMGGDLVHGNASFDAEDPLLGATPFPPESVLPGWRDSASSYFMAMEQVASAMMRSIARGLQIDETTFDAAFVGGLSTLRLTHYPVRPEHSFEGARDEDLWTMHKGERRFLTGRAHADTGFLTLLAQHGVSGLQAKRHDGEWIDVPPTEGALAVNFGKVLERWTGGRVKATLHRVLGSYTERYSIPFFYEPKPEAVIAPLPLKDISPFEPFYYGDHLWETITKYNVEFRGIGHLRKPIGPPPAASV